MQPAERLVAEYVPSNVDGVIHGTLVTIASASGVSEPTVLRFCRSAGFKSFGEFKPT
jgi:RpiR family carbohydrate utilization transcriptional regulator